MRPFSRYFLAFVVIAFTFSCQEPEDGIDGKDGQDAAALLFNVVDVAAGEDCPNGGVRVEIGTDVNADGTLSSEEVQETFFICNGTDGDDGATPADVLVEQVAEPAGANCSDGGVKLLVGRDANGNGQLDTEEVDHVSYICNGTVTGNAGKTYLILTGDITDAQAATRIAQDAGENTQFVWIVGTTMLTTVDLSGITELAELKIEENEALQSVNLGDLTRIVGDAHISDNVLNSIDLGSLVDVFGAMYISGNDGLTTLDLKNLRGALDRLVISVNDDLTSVEFAALERGVLEIFGNKIAELELGFLTDAAELDLYIHDTQLTSLNLANLTQVGDLSMRKPNGVGTVDLSKLISAGALSFFSTTSGIFDLGALTAAQSLHFEGPVTQIVLPELATIDEKFALYTNASMPTLIMDKLTSAGAIEINGSVSEVSMTALVDAGDKIHIVANGMTALDIGSLKTVSDMSITNSDLTTIDLSSLEEVGPQFVVAGNTSMASINIDALSTVSSGAEVHLSGNAFDSNVVDYLLAKLASLDPALTDANIHLNQVTPATPSANGLVAKNVLLGNNNSVNTD